MYMLSVFIKNIRATHKSQPLKCTKYHDTLYLFLFKKL